MSLPAFFPGAATAVLLLSSEEGEHAAEKFLGIPMSVWQLANLVLFLAVLIYFVARPMSAAFRKRQLEIEDRRKEAEKQRAEAQKLASEIRERTARIEHDIEEISKQAVAEGEAARTELAARADQEAARVSREAQEEIDRRVTAARDELRRVAGDLTANSAQAILSKEITDADRQRLLSESVQKVKATP